MQVHYSAGMLYDALRMWAFGMKNSLAKKQNDSDGKALTDEIMKVTFEGEFITEFVVWLFNSEKI